MTGRSVLQWNAELTVMHALEDELRARDIADAVLALAHADRYHSISETGPTSSNTVWYAKCSCTLRFQASSVDEAMNAQQAHVAAVLYEVSQAQVPTPSVHQSTEGETNG